VHEGLALEVVRFLIALLGAEGIREQPTRLSLRVRITACERQRFAAAAFGLMGVAFREAQPPAFDP
jgi:hypothetical protein